MTSSHVIFIPGVLMVGMFLGFILGTRAARNQFDLQRKREAEREATRAARAAKKGAGDAPAKTESKSEKTEAKSS